MTLVPMTHTSTDHTTYPIKAMHTCVTMPEMPP